MNIWGSLLKMFGWSVDITVTQRDKCVICVAPHTSNYDFLLGLAAYRSMGREANFLMKKFWFFFPLSILLKHFGGIPVDRKKHSGSLTESIIEDFSNRAYLNLAVTPEGTRSRNEKWKTGFLYIASGAGVPVQLGIIDYRNKSVKIKDEYYPTGDINTDMDHIKAYYADASKYAKYPDKFSI